MCSDKDDVVISVKNVSKCFEMFSSPAQRLWQVLWNNKCSRSREFWALKDINFELKKGHCTGIIGRNGAGKSTLLQIIVGTLPPTSGSVMTKGRITALLELGSGFNPEYSGRDNVYMNAAILGFSQQQTDELYDSIVEFAGIGDFIDQPVKNYSSGMMVRLAFAVQVSVDPDLLIVDEALAVGDAAFQFKCLSRIKEMVAKGTSVLFVSHDSGMIKSFCDQCIWLKNGNIFMSGPAGEVATAYEREIRIETEELLKKELGTSSTAEAGNPQKNDVSQKGEIHWEVDERIEKCINCTRHGNGQARFVKFEILNSDEEIITSADFDQTVKIRLYFEVKEPLRELSVFYLIYDAKRNPLLGSGNYMQPERAFYNLAPGKYVSEFTTKLPITAGLYSLTAALSTFTVHDLHATQYDYVENGLVFSVDKREPDRIWSMCQLENQVKLFSV